MDDALSDLSRLYREQEPSRKGFQKLKTEVAKRHKLKRAPSNVDLLLSLNPDDPGYERMRESLLSKPVRKSSGVSVIAAMTEPRLCPHGKCTYCPGGPKSALGDVPMAYTGHEPASMRGARTGYDAYLQVFTRLEQYVAGGHIPQKIELIIMGGTLPSYEIAYQESFVWGCLAAMNDFSDLFVDVGRIRYGTFKEFFELPGSLDDAQREARIHDRIREVKKKNVSTLAQAHERNERAFVRCVGMTMETRADFADLEHANRMLEQGATRVELGVQSVYDDVLEMTGRSHGSAENIHATHVLKDLGFKVNFHLMPGLPNVPYDRDLTGLKEIFDNPNYRPDMIKIYPTGVFPGTVLHEYYVRGMYEPLRVDDAVDLLADFKPHVPTYCRIMRVQRDIPSTMLVDGVLMTNLRQLVHAELERRGTRCRCIRCREASRIPAVHDADEEILVLEYEASQGKEFFISYEDTRNDRILGFVRVRFPSQCLREEITNTTALIRELHVYGDATPIGDTGVVQHRGIGKKLMARAESIAREHGFDRMLVISGIGVREYYEKLGYVRFGPYMGKAL